MVLCDGSPQRSLALQVQAFVPQKNLFSGQPRTVSSPGGPGRQLVAVPSTLARGSPLSPACTGRCFHGEGNSGHRRKPALRYTSLEPSGGPRWGVLSAIDTTNSGKIKWQVKTTEPLVGGALATATCFSWGGQRSFQCVPVRNRTALADQSHAGVNAPPVTYQVGGKQYVAVAAGGNSLFGSGSAVMAFACLSDPQLSRFVRPTSQRHHRARRMCSQATGHQRRCRMRYGARHRS